VLITFFLQFISNRERNLLANDNDDIFIDGKGDNSTPFQSAGSPTANPIKSLQANVNDHVLFSSLHNVPDTIMENASNADLSHADSYSLTSVSSTDTEETDNNGAYIEQGDGASKGENNEYDRNEMVAFKDNNIPKTSDGELRPSMDAVKNEGSILSSHSHISSESSRQAARSHKSASEKTPPPNATPHNIPQSSTQPKETETNRGTRVRFEERAISFNDNDSEANNNEKRDVLMSMESMGSDWGASYTENELRRMYTFNEEEGVGSYDQDDDRNALYQNDITVDAIQAADSTDPNRGQWQRYMQYTQKI
jgi:hypothetical protein